MPAVGIISVQKKKETIKDRFRYRVYLTEHLDKEIPYITAEMNISAERFARLGQRRRGKYLLKAENLLKKAGAASVLADVRCNVKCVYSNEIHRGIPIGFISECFKIMSEKMCIHSDINRLAIYDESLSFANEDSLADLVMGVKYVDLHTMCKDKASIAANKIFDRYGVLINIKNTCDIQKGALSDALIDIDRGRIRIGDFAADGVILNTDFDGVSVDDAELLSCEAVSQLLQIRCIVSGKNILKIS